MTTALSLYGTQTVSTPLATADRIVTATGGTASSKTTLIGTSTGYGELYAQGKASAWAAAGSLPAPSGHGFLFDATTLEGQTLRGGAPTLQVRGQLSVAATLVATLYGRLYTRSSGGVYTLIGSANISAPYSTTATTYTLTFATLDTPFGTGDKLYVDVFLNITSNTGGTSLNVMKLYSASSATGLAQYMQLITPGYDPTVVTSPRTIASTITLLVTGSRTVTATTPLLQTTACAISATTALSGTGSVTTGYSYTKALTIDHTKVSGGATLTNFPMLISHTDAALKVIGSGGHVTSSSGFDIIFTDSTGTTQYNHELVNYVSTTGQIIAWVQVPSVSSSADTPFAVFYGNASVTTTQEHIAATWDSNYLGVYHLDDPATGAMKDSTGHQAGTTVGMVSGDSVAGPLYKALNFNGSSKSVNVSTTNSVKGSAQVTISAWVNLTALATTVKFDIYSEAQNSGNTRFNFIINTSNKVELNGRATDAGSLTTWATSTATLAISTWYYCVGIYDSVTDTHHVLINGVDTTASVAVATFPATTPSVATFIGAHSGGTSEYINAVLAGVHLSKTMRSVGWCQTEYTNQLTPGSFYNQGTEAPTLTTATRTIPATIPLFQTPTRTLGSSTPLFLTKSRTVGITSSLLMTKSRGVSTHTALMSTKTRTLGSSTPLLATKTRAIPATTALLATKTRGMTTRGVLQATKTRLIPSTTALLLTKSRSIGTHTALTITKSRSLSCSVALIAPKSRTVGSSAPLLSSKSRSVPVAGVLLATRTRTTPTTAVLLARRTVPCSVALFWAKTRVVSATTPLVTTKTRTMTPLTTPLLRAQTRVVPVSCALKATRTRTVLATITLTLIGTQTRTIPASSALLAIRTRTVGSSAPLLSTKSRSVPIHAAVLATKTRSIGCHTPLILAKQRAIVAHADLFTSPMRGIPTQAALFATRTRMIAATTPLVLSKTRTVPAHTPLLAMKGRGVGVSIALVRSATHTVPAHVALMSTKTRTLPTHTALMASKSRGVSTHTPLTSVKRRSIGASVTLIGTGTTRLITVTIALFTPKQRTVPCTFALYVTVISNTTIAIRSGAALCLVRSGDAVCIVSSEQASLLMRSGQAIVLVRSGASIFTTR